MKGTHSAHAAAGRTHDRYDGGMLALAVALLPLAFPTAGASSHAADGRSEGKAALRTLAAPEARIELLERRATSDDRAAPAAANALFVSAGLEDERAIVRKRAAELLADGMHPPTAREALLRAAKKQPDFRREVNERGEQAGKKLPKVPPPGSARPLDVKKVSDAIDAVGEAAKESLAVEEQRQALVRALARFRDDRAIDAIRRLRDPGFDNGLCVDALALLEFGTSNALEGALERAGDLARATDENERRLRKARTTVPSEKEASLSERVLKQLMKRSDELREDEQRLLAAFASFSTARELAAPPGDLRAKDAWRAWLEGARAELPATIAPPPPQKKS